MRGLVRVAAVTPHLHLANVEKNVAEHLKLLREAAGRHASVAVFPELSLTGSTCGNLFYQQTLLAEVVRGVRMLAEEMPDGITAVVGAPLAVKGSLYNCAVALNHQDGVVAVIPKICAEAPFVSGEGVEDMEVPQLSDEEGFVTMDAQKVFSSEDGVVIGVEIGADLYSPVPASTVLTLGGAEIMLNLAAVPELVEGRARRRELVCRQSAAGLCGYVYASAGPGESTTDLLFSGHCMAAVCGKLLKENADFIQDDHMLLADIDVERIRADRLRSREFAAAARRYGAECGDGGYLPAMMLDENIEPDMQVSKQPFIPADRAEREKRCLEIFQMQAWALARRMSITGNKVVVGISGGLDSTLALLAAVKAADLLGLPRTNILGVTMPCFGTTDWTYQSALELMTTLGVTQMEIPIHEAVRQHFRDIGHDEKDHSVAYENAQARERTQVLMDMANKFGGIVLGTGDLSEIALGWCTYNADHMSMYGVNSGVPKTLVRWVVKIASQQEEFAPSKAVLERILDTPISPELLPPDEKGNIAQQTEDLVGPYALHDFFLYYAVRYAYEPRKVYELCCLAFREDFDRATILKWLKNFYRRFWTQQFKRSCSPDGVKIGSVGLSPRGDWTMPSDAQSAAWLRACEELTV